jgi:hypothetical protein
METRKSKRSVRLALVLGAAIAGTALVGWGGLAAWQAYTQNNNSQITVGTLTHTNKVDTTGNCPSTHSGTPVNCGAIFNVDEENPDSWQPVTGSVTITSTGSMPSAFTMSMPSPTPVGLGNFCPDLTLTVTDSSSVSVYGYSLGSAMGPTTLSPTNADSPWTTNDTNTYTFTVTPPANFASNAAYMGLGCSFDVLFTQTNA